MALSHIDPCSDSETNLSDPPDDFDDMDLDMEEDNMGSTQISPLKRKAISRSIIFDEDDESIDDLSDVEIYRPVPKRARLVPHINSKFEEVPTEVLNHIVSRLSDDHDLFNLTCSCAAFAAALVPEESAVWKERFLSRYDYPRIADSTQFAFAYQLRRAVLRQFVEFTNPQDPRLAVQLEVLRDMVIEAYNFKRSHLPPPLTSKNLAAFASPHNSPWIRIFLSCFLFPCRGQRYGQAHPLFDALQLVLSHLLLSPSSQMAHLVKSSRANYDLALVYAWDKPFALLYSRLDLIEETPEPVQPTTTRMRRNMRPKKTPPKAAGPTHSLDTHALLHIRNFWHHHLLGEPGFGSADLTVDTYGKMVRDLMRAGIVPKIWDKPLKDGNFQIATEWYGHYSTLAHWPRKRQELEEEQCVAEDWEKVDPLKLDFAISTNNDEDGFWSPILRSIPAFEKTIPDLKSCSCIFIRGLAPFVELSTPGNDRRTPRGSQATLSLPATPQLPKYHPYLAMRLRGVIHSIPAQPQSIGSDGTDHSIPGWNRVVMVLYKLSKRHLIQVLEHAEEEFGDNFGSAITTQMMQNGTMTNAQIAQMLNGTAPTTGTPLDAAEIDAHFDRYLRDKLLSNELWRDGSKLDKDAIEEMEEKFRLSEYLDWNDMDYAYAYEGVLLPGEKIMMGRWWRVAMNGQGDGMEWSDALDEMEEDGAADDAAGVDGDGDTIFVDGGQGGNGAAGGNGNGNGRTRYKKLERGPFIFWC
ncbi:hypothetical protein H2200_009212 [Cladophialophora chaetospira]|uniref:F-box domain-containing protein n=1 Tax=Cladophialophora chaetospira TaxID=386627 RepID=A0AA39CFC4_9EURO|nr:hypothetical protein H2200_009212 [Cladophialophora chaetospira]